MDLDRGDCKITASDLFVRDKLSFNRFPSTFSLC